MTPAHPKQLTEAEFWDAAAKAWDEAEVPDGCRFPVARFCGKYTCGLCGTVSLAFNTSRISNDVYISACERMKSNGALCGSYCWPLTLAGAKKRAAFCRRMARLCRKELQIKEN